MGRRIGTNPLQPPKDRSLFALGLEGSANKLGIGVVEHAPDGSVLIRSNVRHTFITPPGEGFLPGETAKHHREHIMDLVKSALADADATLSQMDVICFTKGAFLLRCLILRV